MGYDFNADDIFEIAEQLERDGASFYRKAAESTDNPANKNFLIELAEMEDQHEAIFNAMRAEFSQSEKTESVFAQDNEAAVYLQALANTRVFFEKKMNPESIEDIFMSAITAEKDSIVFYLGLQDMVPEALGKSRIGQILEEEKEHLKLLSQKLFDLKK